MFSARSAVRAVGDVAGLTDRGGPLAQPTIGNSLDQNPSPTVVGETRASGQTGLDIAVQTLASLVAGNGTIDRLLNTAAVLTLQAVPGADGVGVTMMESGRSDIMAASDSLVRDVDAIQYRLGEGPCISATRQGRTTMSRSLGEDGFWPVFGPQAAALDVHSALSLPLRLSGGGCWAR